MPNVSEMAILGERMEEFRPRLLLMLENRVDPRLRSRVAPEEILQDAFLKAHQQWKRTRGTAPIETYVWWYGLCRDCLFDSWKKHTRDMRDLQREVPLPSRSSFMLCEIFYRAEDTPSQALARVERMDILRMAMDQLSDDQQEILWMRHFDQLKHREIAELLRCTESAATLRYSRALLKLRRILTAMGFEL